MKNYFKNIIEIVPQGSFLKNVSILTLGTGISQIIILISYPFIAKLYEPAEFGVFELTASTVMIFTSIASFKYDQAIIIADDTEEAYDLMQLSLILIGICAILSGIIIVLFSSSIEKFLKIESNLILYILPVILFFTSIFNPLKTYCSRFKRFSTISKVNVSRSIMSVTLQVVLGLFNLKTYGLILGNYIPSVFINSTLLNNLSRKYYKLDIARLKELAVKYVDFPKYSLLSTLLNSLVIYGTIFFISNLFDKDILGQIAMANRFLNLPLALISGSLSEVFLQKISRCAINKEKSLPHYMKMFKYLTLTSLFGATIAYLTIPIIFDLFLGQKWEKAGVFASWLIILYAIRFITTPLSTVYIVYREQKQLLFWIILQLSLLILLYAYAKYFTISPETFVAYFIISQGIFYLLFTYRGWQIVNLNDL